MNTPTALHLPPTPSAAEVISARKAANLTQTAAAALLGVPQPRWAEYENGTTRMPAQRWALWLLLADLHPVSRIVPR
jgi:DNA-binding transcriptional regulator YiaG